MRHILLLCVAFAGCSSEPSVQGVQTEDDPRTTAAEPAPPAQLKATDYTVIDPVVHENLSVFLICKPQSPKEDFGCLTLEEALKAGVVNVTESSAGAQVNKLELENRDDRPVYIQSGDTVKGGQQDRTIAVDFMLPAKSGKITVDAFCVEPGRWSTRATTSQSGGLAFTLAEAPVATKEQRLAVRLEKSQAKLWTAGSTVNSKIISGRPVDSYVLATEDPEVKKMVAGYTDKLSRIVEGKEDVVGIAYAINGNLNTVEIYGTTGLFLKLWPKLLKGCSVEAIAKKEDKKAERAAGIPDVTALLEEAAKAPGRMESLPAGTRMKVYAGDRTVLFDTERGGELLHRQVIKK